MPDPTAGHDYCEQAGRALRCEYGYLRMEELDTGGMNSCVGLEGWCRLPPLASCLPHLPGHWLQPRVIPDVSGALAWVLSGLIFCTVCSGLLCLG